MVADHTQEVIFVGLPGPTHNYGGLSGDNLASSLHRGNASNPREAALQAVKLMRLLKGLGIEVGILPPQLRPHLPLLREQGMGEVRELIERAAKENPELLEKASSSSAMWTANAATVTPGIDAKDGKLHLSVANLHTNLHRRIEAHDTHRVLSAIFSGVPNCIVHPPLASELRDEGAANHMRLSPTHDAKGLHVFVYGTDGNPADPKTARQTLGASEQICAQHVIPPEQAIFVQQHPRAIELGVFHNDVIAVSNESLLLVHEHAYARGFADIARIEAAYQQLHRGKTPILIICRGEALTIEEAVRTYFFNSQIVTTRDQKGTPLGMAILAPTEVQTQYGGKGVMLMERICEDDGNPIDEVHYVDLRQSMNNGGGPACLRLRVPMTGAQLSAVKKNVNVMIDDALSQKLEALIEQHYPRELKPKDIADPTLYETCKNVLAELGALLRLPVIPA